MAIGDNNKIDATPYIEKAKKRQSSIVGDNVQTSSLKYQGALMIPIEITPRPMAHKYAKDIDELHCTLLLPRQLKELKEIHDCSNSELKLLMEAWIECQSQPPIPQLGSKVFIAARVIDTYPPSLKSTFFIGVTNPEEMQEYLDKLTDDLGIERVQRFFHVSFANDTGKGTDSIGDICEDDMHVWN